MHLVHPEAEATRAGEPPVSCPQGLTLPLPHRPPPPPWAAAATGEDQTPRSSFVTTPCSAYRPEYGDLPLPGSPRPTPKPFLQH